MSALKLLFRLGIGLAVLASVTRPAPAAVQITNLASYVAEVAVYRYEPARDRVGDFMVFQPEGWRFVGWFRIGPGATQLFQENHIYVRGLNGREWWSGMEETPGFIHPSQAFGEFVSKAGWPQDTQRLLDRGFQQVPFQTLPDGAYNITGDQAYRIISRTIDFNYEHRDRHVVRRSYSVDGLVVDYSVSASSRWANANWTRHDRFVFLTLDMEGRVTGPLYDRTRSPAIYRGSITISYTVRN